MKRFLNILSVVMACAFFAAGCNDDAAINNAPHHDGPNDDLPPQPAPKATIFSIEASYPKTASGESLYAWTGDETIGLLFGNVEKSPTANAAPGTVPVPVKAVAPGKFQAAVNIDSLTTAGWSLDDLVGIVYPCNEHNWAKSKSPDMRIVMHAGGTSASGNILTQSQAASGVANPEFLPVFAPVKFSNFSQGFDADSNVVYSLSNLDMKYGCSILKINIHGTNSGFTAGEKIQKVTLFAASEKGVCGNSECTVTDGTMGSFAVNGNAANPVEIAFTGNATLDGTTAESPFVVYSALAIRNSSIPFSYSSTNGYVTVTTDKGEHTWNIPSQTPVRMYQGEVAEINVDFSTVDPGPGPGPDPEVSDLRYSIDGGKSWVDDLPAGPWATLKVKTDTSSLTNAQLKAISDAIKEQSPAVALDLSGATYESNVFPSGIFSGSSSALYTGIKSIEWPSNITELAENACRYSSFESVNIPKTITKVGKAAFRYCFSLKDIYYNSPDPSDATTAMYTFGYTNTVANILAKPEVNVTFGPDVVTVPAYAFYFVQGLKSITFESAPVLSKKMISGCDDLCELIFNSTTPPVYGSSAVAEIVDGNCSSAAATKKIIVPAGCAAAYAATDWAQVLTGETIGFVIEEKGAVVTHADLQYSTDGGKTWVDELPSGSWATLNVKTDKTSLSSDQLKAISAAIKGQSPAVALDLSGATYESNVFPTGVFSGTGTSDIYTGIKSIEWPSNITELAQNACYYSSLESVNIPKTITKVGKAAFRYCYSLKEIYYNSPDPSDVTTAMYTFGYTNTVANILAKPEVNVTIGPDVVTVPAYAFFFVQGLKSITFEGSPALSKKMICGCSSLCKLKFKGATPPVYGSSAVADFADSDTGKDAATKQIAVPAGCTAAYAATDWAAVLTGKGFTIVEE